MNSQRLDHYRILRDKWSTRHKNLQDQLWKKHGKTLQMVVDKTKQLAIGGGMLAAAATPSGLLIPSPLDFLLPKQEFVQNLDKKTFLIADLHNVLPDKVRVLSRSEEDVAAQTLTRHFGVSVAPELEGKRLNRNYGYIGAEQHLARYPGDTIDSHFDSEEDARKFISSGMAPGLGAWGYFARSQDQMTENDNLREKYYVAVQTFLSEDFNKRFTEYRDFYKYRKMLVVNAQNGKAVVAVIGDAGPAEWTGKHLGGSPEVMKYLERVDGRQKGPVLYFFIDDPEDKIPLGPIDIQ